MSAVNGREGKNLPPTVGTLIPHVFRAFYSALVIKLAIILGPEIPPPFEYYWVCKLLQLRPKLVVFLNNLWTSINNLLKITHQSIANFLFIFIFQCHFGNGIFEPVMCINDPLPSALSDFKQCKCKATTKRCTKLSCTCVKYGLKCTELCGCGEQCENMSVEEVVWDESEGEAWLDFL